MSCIIVNIIMGGVSIEKYIRVVSCELVLNKSFVVPVNIREKFPKC